MARPLNLNEERLDLVISPIKRWKTSDNVRMPTTLVVRRSHLKVVPMAILYKDGRDAGAVLAK